MGRQHPRAFSWRVVAAGAVLMAAGCGSIQVVSDGGSDNGSGGSPATGAGGHIGGAGTGGGPGTGGTTGQGGATGLGGGSGQGGKPGGTGGAIPDAGGCICQAIVQPVCGADGRTYTNSCEAQCAGVAVAHQGACVDAGVMCTRVQGCCSVDSDCNGNEECAGIACGANGRASGVCKQPPNRAGGRCWTDADCPGAATCTGAIICPCNAACLRPDMLGTCSA